MTDEQKERQKYQDAVSTGITATACGIISWIVVNSQLGQPWRIFQAGRLRWTVEQTIALTVLSGLGFLAWSVWRGIQFRTYLTDQHLSPQQLLHSQRRFFFLGVLMIALLILDERGAKQLHPKIAIEVGSLARQIELVPSDELRESLRNALHVSIDPEHNVVRMDPATSIPIQANAPLTAEVRLAPNQVVAVDPARNTVRLQSTSTGDGSDAISVVLNEIHAIRTTIEKPMVVDIGKNEILQRLDRLNRTVDGLNPQTERQR